MVRSDTAVGTPDYISPEVSILKVCAREFPMEVQVLTTVFSLDLRCSSLREVKGIMVVNVIGGR